MRSFLTIAAADSSNGLHGCRGPKLLTPMAEPLPCKEWHGHLTGPLLGRGWVYQELDLSVRIVYYRSDGMSWECREKECRENVMINNEKIERKNQWAHGAIYRSRFFDGNPEEWLLGPTSAFEPCYRWLKLVEGYSAKQLTFKDD
jgi:hypothetical protein